MTATELAERLGISIDTFYRTRGRMHADDQMPAPITRHRPFRWHRASIEAWLGRHHPNAPLGRPANDTTAPAVPESIDEQRAYLARAYGRR